MSETADSLLGLDGAVVAVTGAGQGLGRGIARLFARAGAHVAVLELDPETAAAAASELGRLAPNRRMVGLPVDLTDADAAARSVGVLLDTLGDLDVWVNNAGGWAGTQGAPSLEFSAADWRPVLELNLVTTFHCCQLAARAMIDRGHGGAIVNISSLQGRRASPVTAAYGAAKAAVAHLTESLALEWAEHGIRVNAVAPGFVDTPASARFVTPERKVASARAIPLGRISTPEEVGGTVLALASDLAGFVTGQTVVADGGLSLTTARPHRGE